MPTDDCANATINAVNEDICPPHHLPKEQRKELLALLIQMVNSTLTDSQVHDLSQLILSYHDVFSLQEQECGGVDGITHVINTDNHPPINQLPQHVPFTQRKEMSKLVNEMLQNNVIEDSSSHGPILWC